jgi:hypothetical protein
LSRQRSAGSRLSRRALFASLLRHEQRFQDPGADIVEAAAELQALSLIRLRHGEAVFCANPNDRDFPPRDPDCRGLIELHPGADEGAGDYACPICDRVVHPTLKAKERAQVLTTSLDQQGIERFVKQQLGPTSGELAFEKGTFVLPGRPQNRFICIVDFCTDPLFLDREWIETQPCIYITVDPRVRIHLGTRHVRSVQMVDLVCGDVALDELLDQASRADPLASRTSPALRAYPRASSGPEPTERLRDRPSRKFAVGLIGDGIVVEGTAIECDGSGLPYLSFAELMQQAASDVGSGREIAPLTARKIAERIDEKIPGATVDPDSVQKALKRLDRSIVERLKQAGLSVGEGEVIENVARVGKYRGRHGFRLNSDRVLLEAKAPGQTGASEATAPMSDSTRSLRKVRP